MTYANDDDLPQIKSADACAAIGRPLQWLKNRVGRTPPVVLLLPEERVGVGDRTYLSLTLKSVVHLAIVSRLERFMTPREAHGCAAAFTYFGSSELLSGQERDPGELFADGLTFLFARPGQGHVEPLSPKTTKAHAFMHAGLTYTAPSNSTAEDPAIVLDISHLVWRVRAALGLPR